MKVYIISNLYDDNADSIVHTDKAKAKGHLRRLNEMEQIEEMETHDAAELIEKLLKENKEQERTIRNLVNGILQELASGDWRVTEKDKSDRLEMAREIFENVLSKDEARFHCYGETQEECLERVFPTNKELL